MLETIREYALERLEDSGEAPGRLRRHADYFLALAEEAEPNLIGTGSHAEWLDRLERDHANLRAALDWFEASVASGEALRLAAALWRFWDLRGHLVEGRRRLENALSGDERPTAARAKALSGAADMALTNGDVTTGGVWAEEALELHRTLGDRWGIAFSLLMVAYAVGQQGDWARAQQLYDESAQRFHSLGDEHYAGRAGRSLAWAHYEAGDLERARAVNEENLRHARTIDDKLLEGVALVSIADCAVGEDRFEEAAALMKEGLGILRDVGDLLMSVAAVSSHRTRACPRRETTTGRPPPFQRCSAARRDRCEAPLAHEDHRPGAECHPRAARRSGFRRRVGAGSDADGGSSRRIRPRFTRLNCAPARPLTLAVPLQGGPARLELASYLQTPHFPDTKRRRRKSFIMRPRY